MRLLKRTLLAMTTSKRWCLLVVVMTVVLSSPSTSHGAASGTWLPPIRNQGQRLALTIDTTAPIDSETPRSGSMPQPTPQPTSFRPTSSGVRLLPIHTSVAPPGSALTIDTSTPDETPRPTPRDRDHDQPTAGRSAPLDENFRRVGRMIPFSSTMNEHRPREWCYNEDMPKTPVIAANAVILRRFAASTFPQIFDLDSVVTPTEIMHGAFDRRTRETITRRYTLHGVTGGANNVGVYVVEHRGERRLMKTMRNYPSSIQDSAKSATREAFVQAVAAEAVGYDHALSVGIVPVIRVAGLEDVWEPNSFLVMDFIDPFDQLAKNNDKIARYTMTDLEFLKVALSLMGVISRTLQAGVSHNDIKERNVIILKDHRVALIDFGESCLLYFDRAEPFRERFSCHLFNVSPERRSVKYWVDHALHSAGFSDVRAALTVLDEVLSHTVGVRTAEELSGILLRASHTENPESIYSDIPARKAEGGGACIDLRTPIPSFLVKVHVRERESTKQALLLLERVERDMRGVIEGAGLLPSGSLSLSPSSLSAGGAVRPDSPSSSVFSMSPIGLVSDLRSDSDSPTASGHDQSLPSALSSPFGRLSSSPHLGLSPSSSSVGAVTHRSPS